MTEKTVASESQLMQTMKRVLVPPATQHDRAKNLGTQAECRANYRECFFARRVVSKEELEGRLLFVLCFAEHA